MNSAEKLVKTVRNVILDRGLASKHLGIAVSGGVDSTTLMHTLSLICDDLSLHLTVMHVDHGLRGDQGTSDALFVESLAKNYGVEFRSTSVNVQALAHETGSGIESAARTARYAFFETCAAELSITCIATGHTMDDNAETVIMNLARGSGLRGLSGIPPERPLNNLVSVFRPFITLSRNEIEEAAQTWGLTWCEDATNDELNFLRNRIRHQVMPVLKSTLGAGISEQILRSSGLIRQGEEIVSSVVRDVTSRAVSTDLQGNLHLDIQMLGEMPFSLAAEVIRSAVHLRFEEVERLMLLLGAQVGSIVTLSGKRKALRERGFITISTTSNEAVQPGDELPELVINIPGAYVAGSASLIFEKSDAHQITPLGNPDVAYFDARCIQGSVRWRVWKHGDRIRPFGLDGLVLVSDVLTNARVPHSDRHSMRVLTDDDGILWVCGIRQSERGRINSDTTSVLTFRRGT